MYHVGQYYSVYSGLWGKVWVGTNDVKSPLPRQVEAHVPSPVTRPFDALR